MFGLHIILKDEFTYEILNLNNVQLITFYCAKRKKSLLIIVNGYQGSYSVVKKHELETEIKNNCVSS